MDLTQDHVQVPVEGGSMDAFLCRPAGEGKFPAVIIIHEIYGPTPHFEDLACRFARRGYLGVVPDLFWNIELPEFSDGSSFMRFRQELDYRVFLRDLDSAIEYLRSQPFVDGDRIGIVGFCIGGYVALQEAAHNPALAAVVDFYGAPLKGQTREGDPVTSLQAAERLQMPFLGLFGEEDQSIPVEQVRELESVLDRAGVPHQIKVYPNAGHAFFNDTRPTHRKEAAEAAWPLMMDFFDRYLKQSG